jgi:uncharacterized protein with HEPN domain
MNDEVRLNHILSAIEETENYLHYIEYETFIRNSEKQFATVKQIEIIGEACNALTEEVKNANPEIPWKSIKGFRNVSIHEYFGVNFTLVWEIATNDLPILKTQILKILNNL